MLTQYTLSPVRLEKPCGMFRSNCAVYIHDITDHKGKRKSPRRGLQPDDRVKIGDAGMMITAWTYAANLSTIGNLSDMSPRTA